VRRLLLAAVVIGLVGVSVALRSVVLQVQSVPLMERPPPGAACDFVVVLDREPVQFGELVCPGHANTPAMRSGERWFELPPTIAGSPYSRIRRSPDNQHWIVLADVPGTPEIFRSDDGGATFARLVLRGGTISGLDAAGDQLEHVTMSSPATRGRFAAAWYALQQRRGTLRDRLMMALANLTTAVSSRPVQTHWVSDDGGRTFHHDGDFAD
jgi:hypothetical protein